LISYTKTRTNIERISEQGAKKNILTKMEGSNRRLEENCIVRSFITIIPHQILLE
jgi:hypothetical protein